MTSAEAIPPWPDLIAEFGLLRQQVAEVDEDQPFTVPHLAATEEQLQAAEQRLGHALDQQHREFLSFANGWPQFYLSNSLLGTEDLGQGERWDNANANLDAFYGSLEGDNPFIPPRAEIYPISNDYDSASVFVVWVKGEVTDGGHPVVWLPWQDSEPYDSFFDFFRATYQDYEEELEAAEG